MKKTYTDPDELLLRQAQTKIERFVRSHPGGETEARELLRRAVERHLPEVRATVEEILVNSTDPDESAEAAELVVAFSQDAKGYDA